MTEPSSSADADAFEAALLMQRLRDRAAGIERTAADYARMFPGREALVASVLADAPNSGEQSASEPRTLGHYLLLRRLGRGGQGEVWLAEDPRLARKVAIKVLRNAALASRDALLRFRREAEAASKLDHPGICAVYDVGLEQGLPYLVMRHVDGGTLADLGDALLPRGQDAAARARRVATIVERLARALHVAHEAGVLHRDVKPSNVLMAADDQPVLVDFGLARLMADESLFTRTGELFGTPAYLAPELLAASPAAPDRRSDVYALGVVLYELLTGSRPYAAPTLDSLYRQIALGLARPAHVVSPAVPKDLAVIVSTAMATEPQRRYATALALAEDLQRWREHRPILARQAGLLVRAHRWLQRSPLLAALLLALLLSLAIGFLVSLQLWRGAMREQQRAEALLGEWERLADRRRLEELVREAADLWPATPQSLPLLDAWQTRARPLLARLPAHRLAFVELAAQRRSDASDELRWREQQLGELLRGLESFGANDPHGATAASVAARRRWAESVVARTLEQPAAAWAAASARVAGNARYRGLQLRPQLGLVPLGPDPVTQLEEFAGLQTGEVPPRDASGRLQVSAEAAVVFVLLPAGSFVMGAQNAAPQGPNYDPNCWVFEVPPQRVELAAFLIAKHELTQAQWRAVMGDNPSGSQPGSEVRGVVASLRHPVTNVSWLRCQEFVRRCGWALPTEAQWEYACRAETTTPWSTGGTPESVVGYANFADAASASELPSGLPTFADVDDGYALDAPVGSFRANAFGLYDLHGNVSEWCREDLERYGSAVLRGSGERPSLAKPVPGREPNRIHRGGTSQQMPKGLRSSARAFDQVTTAHRHLGMRPSRALDG